MPIPMSGCPALRCAATSRSATAPVWGRGVGAGRGAATRTTRSPTRPAARLLRLIWDRCAATTTCSRPTAAGHCSSLSLAGSCGPPRSRPATRFGPNPSSRRYRSRARRRRIPRTTNRHLPPRRPSRSGHPHRSHPGRHRRNPRRLTPTSSRRSEQRATPPHDRPDLRHVPSIGVASVGRVDGGCGGRPPPGIRRRYRMKALVSRGPGRKAQGLAVVR